MGNHLSVFFKQFVSAPLSVGSIIPSSRFLSQKMIAGIQNPANKKVLELGPGTGAITYHLEKSMTPKCAYMGFEISESFYGLLSLKFPKLDFVNDGAENMHRYLDGKNQSVDMVISSIPFTTVPGDLADEILKETYKHLKPGGVFRTFLYLHTYFLRKNQAFIFNVQQNFDLDKVEFVPLNFPPALAITFRKPK